MVSCIYSLERGVVLPESNCSGTVITVVSQSCSDFEAMWSIELCHSTALKKTTVSITKLKKILVVCEYRAHREMSNVRYFKILTLHHMVPTSLFLD